MTNDQRITQAVEETLAAIIARYPDIERRFLRRHLRSLATRSAAAPTPADRLLTQPEVAQRLGITRAWAGSLARRFGIGARIGNQRLYSENDVAALRDAMRANPPGRPVGWSLNSDNDSGGQVA